jgi:hypothetical protein
MSTNDFVEQTCPVCHGQKIIQKTDFLSAVQKMVPCDKCFGRGTIQIKPEDINGVTVMQQMAANYWYSDYINGNVVSSMLVFQCPIMVNGLPGKTLIGKKLDGTPLYNYRIFMQIINMYTKPKHRREGRMKRLVEFAMGDPKIEWVETQWDSSSDYGRNLLLGMGFIQEGNSLVYRKVKDETT